MKHFLSYCYSLIPFKKYIYSCCKRFISLPPSIFRHLHFKGEFSIGLDNASTLTLYHPGKDFSMESDHFWKGEGACEPYSIKAWTFWAKTATHILDIGANTGTYALLAAAYNPTAIIHAFEPNPSLVEIIKRNNTRNQFNIDVHTKAVADTKGKLYWQTNPSTYNDYTAHRSSSPTNTIVDGITLADFIREHKIPISSIMLVKIDVEGYETEVLLGGGTTLFELQPIFLIEVLNDKQAKRLQLLPYWEGYSFYTIEERKGFKQTDTLVMSPSNNCIAIPHKWYSLWLEFLKRN
ncbi:MAG: FkbM family methyltransferase [Cytophagaceae bacterium]|jgi:FkbM family methyltransferase|nr:FkbM family methyltransferase [Cytophagaceae bacterium]